MTSGKTIGVAAGYVAVLLLLGVTDAVVTSGRNVVPVETNDTASVDAAPDATGVPRQTGPNVFDVLNELGIVTQSTREEGMLRRIVPREEPVESRVILKDNDRLAYFAWVDSPDAKIFFTALKEALRTSFSSELQDLVDEVQNRFAKPVRNVLSFLDPAIHSERVLFVRSRQRLYEFHVAPGREPEIQALMDALTD